MAEQFLRYGVKNGVLVSVEDVVSGLACECICPSCGATLVARKGNIREHHFAHHGATDCTHGCESALHMMAKHILESRKEVFVPGETDRDKGEIRHFSTAELESREYMTFIPDVLMKNGADTLCVEVLVTHAVDEDKEQKITTAKLPTIEIDLGSMIEDFDEDSVTEALLSGRETKWIYNSILDEQKKKQRVIDEICDYLPSASSGYSSDWYYCLLHKRRVSLMQGSNSCHECWHFNYNSSQGFSTGMPCNYRERDLLKLNFADFRNVERKSGLIVSVEVLVEGEWQRWIGTTGSTLALEQRRENEGKTVFELWKPEYNSMVVRNLRDGKERLINGSDGKMYTNQKGFIIGKYRNKDQYGKYYYPPKDYVVWDAEKPVWELEVAFKK